MANLDEIYKYSAHDLKEPVTSIHAVLNFKKIIGIFSDYDEMMLKNVDRYYNRLIEFAGKLEVRYQHRKENLIELQIEILMLKKVCEKLSKTKKKARKQRLIRIGIKIFDLILYRIEHEMLFNEHSIRLNADNTTYSEYNF